MSQAAVRAMQQQLLMKLWDMNSEEEQGREERRVYWLTREANMLK